jgi:hypothetical protein
MKEKEKNIYGIHQYTLTRRRKIRGKKRKIKRKPNKEEGKQKAKRINVRKTIHSSLLQGEKRKVESGERLERKKRLIND